MKDKYRFDDAYEKVYEYDAESQAIHIGSYFWFSITADMSDKEKEGQIFDTVCGDERSRV